jgi:hypothetical protein
VDLLERHRYLGAVAGAPAIGATQDEGAARRSLRAQIAKLERELSDAFVTAAAMGGLPARGGRAGGQARLLDLGELELVRDDLAQRLADARAHIEQRADAQERARVHLERMLLEPGKYRFSRVARAELGEPGCGAWHVRPRLGLIGMLMGWWQVKLSSGCPLPRGRAATARPIRPGIPRRRARAAARVRLITGPREAAPCVGR